MKTNEIEKSNIEIALFMNYEHDGETLLTMFNGKPNIDLDTLDYHRCWNWLMPVVEKINIIDDYTFTVIIKSMDVEIYNNVSGKVIFESECKWQPNEIINSVYEAVVEFIKWYNENK